MEVEKFNVPEECHCSACLVAKTKTPPVEKLVIPGESGIPLEKSHRGKESTGSRVSFADITDNINDLEQIHEGRDEELCSELDGLDLTDSEDEDIPDDFELREERGFMRAHCKREGLARYAVKRVKHTVPAIMKEDAAIDLASEAKFLASLSHPNIIKLRAIVGVPGHPEFLMVMDRLYSTMEDNMVPWKKAEKLYYGVFGHFGRRQSDLEHVRIDRMVGLYDVARAMKYLHKYK
jgi:serine/threonine protein kinase